MSFAVNEVALPAAMRGKVTVSIDVEDWHQLVGRQFSGDLPKCSPHVEAQTDRVLDMLDAHGVRGTFFVLGLVARERPDLVRAIARRGHEIASHGILHVPLHRLDRDQVRAELRDSRAMLSDIVGEDIVGFRAPEFSVSTDNLWVLDEVAEAGYRYDSSIFPIAHRRYGIRTFVRGPARVSLANGHLWELPLGTLPTRIGNLPIAGGGYFRLFPGAVLERALSSLERRGDHVMLYFHPYEFTRSRLVVEDDVLPKTAPARLRATITLGLSALGRQRLPGRLERMLRKSQSVRAVDLVSSLESAGLDRRSSHDRAMA